MIQKIRFLLAAAAFVILALSSQTGSAAEGGKEGARETSKEAIVISAFGTSHEKARISYAAVEKEVRAAYPGSRVIWAWTAHSLLKSGGAGDARLSVQEAMAKLATEGVKQVSVLSLHVIPGQEYNNLVATAQAFEGLPKGIEKVRVTPPLMYSTESIEKVAELLLASVPAARKKNEAVVFVGHGTHHAAGVYYPALQYYITKRDPLAFIGTVEGAPDFDDVLASLKGKSVKKLWLAPLMMVAGDHASNDLFGDEEDSWKRRFGKAGIAVEGTPKGLGEHPSFVRHWMSGLNALHH